MTSNCAGGRPFVKISAFCWVVGMYLATIPDSLPVVGSRRRPIWLLKKWYFRARYLFLVDILGTLTRDKHPWLSSKTVDRMRVVGEHLSSSFNPITWRRARMGRTSLMAMLKATYSAAVELKVCSVCSLLDQMIGQPNRVRVKPVRERTQTGS